MTQTFGFRGSFCLTKCGKMTRKGLQNVEEKRKKYNFLEIKNGKFREIYEKSGIFSKKKEFLIFCRII